MVEENPNVFDELLPPGWEAWQDRHDPRRYSIRDAQGRSMGGTQVDELFTLETALRNIWWRHTFPDAHPSMYMRWVDTDHSWDWLPEFLRPEGVKSLDEIGSLGG